MKSTHIGLRGIVLLHGAAAAAGAVILVGYSFITGNDVVSGFGNLSAATDSIAVRFGFAQDEPAF